jgi:two-component sensor histidine kinase
LLADTGWMGADLHTLIMGEIGAYKDRVEVSGCPATVAPLAVQPLAMILHELATNAAKYGALSNETGRVRICWAEQPPGQFILTWSEVGGPPINDQPSAKGFGSRMMKSTAKQVDGLMDCVFAQQGMTCTFTAPMAKMVR